MESDPRDEDRLNRARDSATRSGRETRRNLCLRTSWSAETSEPGASRAHGSFRIERDPRPSADDVLDRRAEGEKDVQQGEVDPPLIQEVCIASARGIASAVNQRTVTSELTPCGRQALRAEDPARRSWRTKRRHSRGEQLQRGRRPARAAWKGDGATRVGRIGSLLKEAQL